MSARRGGEANKQSTEHSTTVVDSLRTRLKDATAEFKEVCLCVRQLAARYMCQDTTQLPLATLCC